MFDFDLQVRLWRSAADAMLHGAQASMAAAAAWQDQINSKKPTPQPAMNLWWLAPWQPAQAVPSATSGFANPYASMMMPWFEMFWRPQLSSWPTPSPAWTTALPTTGFVPLFWRWPIMSWAYMQTPLTAMMMSAGMPYDVASPSAKASCAAMDAADAARQQMDNVFSAYRSDGGHAAAQMAALPWTLAASFMDAAAPAPASSRKRLH